MLVEVKKMETEVKTITKITKDMTIGDVVGKYPQIIDTLASFGIHCVGCHASPYESLEDGFASHGMSNDEIETVVSTLNKVLDIKLKEEESHESSPSHEHSASSNEKVIITDNAASKIKDIMQKENKTDGYGLRIEVVPGGCAGFSYDMTFDNQKKEDAEVIEKNGLKVFVDSQSMVFLKGAKVDYVESLHGAGFKIDNPNATKSCGCGNSFG